jgi:[acyl-carrier-protein] S-malonyltransferase
MLKAEKRMKHFIDNSIFKDPRIPIISNYTAVSSKDKTVLSNNLSKQMSNRVKWVESVQFLEKMQEDTIIEIGPGKVLTGLIKKISNKFKVHNIENISDIMRFKDEFQFKK